MDGIAAKLLRCGIASEALRQNMPLRSASFAIVPEDVFSTKKVGILSSLILGPSRRANAKKSSLISEESGFSPLISEDFGPLSY